MRATPPPRWIFPRDASPWYERPAPAVIWHPLHRPLSLLPYEVLSWLNPPQKREFDAMIRALQERCVLFGAAMRYRAVGEERWREGEAVQIEHWELVFLCNEPFAVNVDVEILLFTKPEVTDDSPLPVVCTGRVVRRVLANWPEVRAALVVSIRTSWIGCEQAKAI